MKSFESLWQQLSQTATERPAGSKTVAELDKGVHEIGKKIIEDSNIFDNFKSSKEYNVILEHVHYELGLQYYDHIQKVGKEIYDKYLNKFLENDQIGNPNQFFYGDGKISPTTLRYIKNCLDLSFLCDDQSVSKIVEVGGGYGGLCKTLSVLCNFNEYLNIDLPETVLLQEKYLKNWTDLHEPTA